MVGRGKEMNQTVNYIKELTAIASPTGFTREIADYLVLTLEELGYQSVRTAKGGVNVTIKGQNDKQTSLCNCPCGHTRSHCTCC